MKVLWLLFLFLCSNSFANQLGFLPDNYFRPMSPGHTIKVVGASISPTAPEQTSLVAETAVFTHDQADGCLLPSVVCETWSPLAVGPSYNAGKFAVVFGPLADVAPAARKGLAFALGALPEQGWTQAAIKGLNSKDQSLTISFGPQLYVNPFDHGTMMPLNRWYSQGRVFAGLSLLLN